MSSVVFMGTPDFAEGILRALIDSAYEVTAVFTQPDKPKGRKGILQAPPVKLLAQEHGIPVYQPQRIRTEENIEILKELKPDFIVAAAFGQIIPPAILDIPRYGCLNVHASLLPRWRGAAPIQWSILAGDRETGVTIMQMAEGLDTGDMIDTVRIPIEPDETGGSLFDKLMYAGEQQIAATMDKIRAGKAVFTPQPQDSPTPYAKMLKKEDGKIDWTRPAAVIERQIRGLSPWPSAYTYRSGKMLKIWRAEVCSQTETTEKVSAIKPGTVIGVTKDHFTIAAGEGSLVIREVQPEGKKRMDAAAFLRGYPVGEGEQFGSEG